MECLVEEIKSRRRPIEREDTHVDAAASPRSMHASLNPD